MLRPKTYAWCPKPQTAKWYCWFDGHCLKEKDSIVPFVKRNAFFLLRMCHLLFLLETSGSVCKFDSFLFYLFFNLILNVLFIYLFPTPSLRLVEKPRLKGSDCSNIYINGRGEELDLYFLKNIRTMSNANYFILDLNLGHQVHFRRVSMMYWLMNWAATL